MRSKITRKTDPIAANLAAKQAKDAARHAQEAARRTEQLLDHDPSANEVKLSEQAEAAIRRPFGKDVKAADRAVDKALKAEIARVEAEAAERAKAEAKKAKAEKVKPEANGQGDAKDAGAKE